MAGSIEDLIREAVRAALRSSVEEMRPALAEAVREAVAAGSTSPTGPYVPVKEAAKIMGAHPATVRKLVASGKLGRFTVEGSVRVKLTDIHAYLAREGQPSPTLNLDEQALLLLNRRAR